MLAEFLYHHMQGVLFFLSAQFVIGLSNIAGITRLNGRIRVPFGGGRQVELDEPLPSVSVLVPARNEEQHIETCTRSLLEQTYPNYELVILDDHSQDQTGEILHRIEAGQPRLTVLEGEALPQGWVGKTWACHQLAQAATGDYLLFTDADTRHHPDMLVDAMTYMTVRDLDFISGMPRQALHTWGERLTVPFLTWIIFAAVPVPLARRVHLPFLSAAVGQFMLFRRESYLQVGGHSQVRHASMEDILLARRVKQYGLRWDFLDLSKRVTCRMYTGMHSSFNGISKNLFGIFHYNLPVFAFVWIWLLLVYIEPVILIAAKATGFPVPEPVLTLAAAITGMSLLLWGMSNWKFRLPLIQTVFYPVTVSLLFIMAARSAIFHYLRRPFDWKGRNLPTSEKT